MTNPTPTLGPWQNPEHDHSRCWWNWEVGRWICPAHTTTRAVRPDRTPTSTEPQEQR